MKVFVSIVLVVVALASLPAGCGGAAPPASPNASVSELPGATSTTSTRPSPTSVTSSEGETTAPGEGPMGDSIEYARSLGGISHEGETLFFVVGTETASEEEAQALLQEGTPFFGDMVSYFIVQKSDNFDGMAPGQWVIIEAYESNPSAENVDFGRRAFPDAYVVRATVLTSDPIPVYEDRLGL